MFCVVWCGLSCFIYSRPYDGPSGTSIVSVIRRIPGLQWFFQQPQSVINSQEEPLNEDEEDPLKDAELGVTGDDSSAGSSQKTEAPPAAEPPRTLLFGDE